MNILGNGREPWGSFLHRRKFKWVLHSMPEEGEYSQQEHESRGLTGKIEVDVKL